MEKTIKTIILPYVTEEGEDKEYKFEIGFISNAILEGYRKINEVIQNVQKNWQKLNKMQNELTSGITKATPEIEKEIAETQRTIQSVSDTDFFAKRYELLVKILKQNKYNEGEYLSPDFWENNVEPKEIISFLTSVVYKDVQEKK